MKRILTIIALFVFVSACGGKQQAETQSPAAETGTIQDSTAVVDQPEAEPTAVTEKLTENALPEHLYLNITVKDYGTIIVELYTGDAPKNVTNVANLAIEGFYDGLTFHRIVPGFVVQGGDPDGTGAGGPGYTVEAEIKRKHEKGCVAMARKPDQVNPEQRSSGSQFYFCLEALEQLDGGYTVIGKIIEGMDIMEKMGQVETDSKDRPVTPLVMEKVTVTAK